MATTLVKKIERLVNTFSDRGRPVMVRVTQEGVYIKRQGEHWSSAVLAPWAAIFSVACKIKAQENKVQRKTRTVRRGLL